MFITFDLDDTLWPCAPVIEAAEHALYGWLQRHAPAVSEVHDIASLYEHRKTLSEQRPDLRHDLSALRLHQLSIMMMEYGYASELAEEGLACFRAARNQVTPYPDVQPMLSMLRRDHVLVSVTNGNAEVDETPLSGYFHRNLTAAEVGAAKPDPALFLAAMSHFGASPSQTLHVGDDPWLDVEAARVAGLQGVWVNRRGASWPAELPPPSLTVTDLEELAALF